MTGHKHSRHSEEEETIGWISEEDFREEMGFELALKHRLDLSEEDTPCPLWEQHVQRS